MPKYIKADQFSIHMVFVVKGYSELIDSKFVSTLNSEIFEILDYSVVTACTELRIVTHSRFRWCRAYGQY